MKKINFHLDFDSIVKIITDYLTVTNPYLEILKKKGLNKFQYFQFCILLRYSINLKALIPLFTSFKSDNTIKLPIFLIFRSILEDYLTVQYLLTFIDAEDEKNSAVMNEIAVIDRDFIKFQEDFLKEELNQFKIDGIPPWNSESKVKERSEQFYSSNPDFYLKESAGYKLKSVYSFRKSTPKKFFRDEAEKKKSLTERYKYDRLKSLSLFHFAIQAYLPYKYFSQFQHPSSNMDRMIMSDPSLVDNRFILMTLENVLVATNQVLSVTLKNKEAVPKIKEIQEEIVKLIKK